MSEDVSRLGHVGVLIGGCSSEREISLRSGKAIGDALKQGGCQVSALDIHFNDEGAIVSLLKNAKIDVAFIALHGQLGEDGVIQSILEKLHIPYAGSGVEASRLAINKISTQMIFQKNGIPVAGFQVVDEKEKQNLGAVMDKIKKFPVVVKPANQGSSIGIALAENKEGFLAALNDAFQYDKEILIEEYIEGRELTVGILDQTALPVIEIKPKRKFFDFTAKYQEGLTEYIIPAQLPADVTTRVQDLALRAHKVLGCLDLSRVDMMLDHFNNPFVLEINTIPGFTASSLLPKAAEAQGIDFTQLCLKIVGMAYRKQKKPQATFI